MSPLFHNQNQPIRLGLTSLLKDRTQPRQLEITRLDQTNQPTGLSTTISRPKQPNSLVKNQRKNWLSNYCMERVNQSRWIQDCYQMNCEIYQKLLRDRTIQPHEYLKEVDNWVRSNKTNKRSKRCSLVSSKRTR